MSNNNQQQKTSSSRKRFYRKKWFIVLATIIIFAGGIFGGWFYISNQKPSSSQATKLDEEINKTLYNTQTLINNGKIADAKSAYDDAISKAETPEQKSMILLSESTMYFNDGKYDEALALAEEAESIIENYSATDAIARIYEIKGDKQNAIKYYQKTINLVDKSQPMSSDDIQYYNFKIKALSE